MNYKPDYQKSQGFRISISDGTANNKQQAGYLTNFYSAELNFEDEDGLRKVFTSRNYSFNYWEENNTCSKDAYDGMFGIILDVDEGLTIEEAKNTFAEYKYIIHTSTSHQVDKDDKPACDRFRVILPFDHEEEPKFTDPDIADAVYEHAKEEFPFADPAVFTRAAKFFPFLGEPDKFYLDINTDGVWFCVDADAVQPVETSEQVVSNRHTNERYIGYDMQIVMSDQRTVHSLETLRSTLINGRQPCYCPFCDDINSRNPSAVVQITQEGYIQMFCSHCKSEGNQHVYWEDPVEPGMFMMENQLLRVQKTKHNAYVVKVDGNYIRNDDNIYARTYISRMRNIPSADFKVERYASANYDTVDYELNIPDGQLKIEIPSSVKPDMEDNGFVNDWLNGLFREYDGFIKDWLALYCYTNYRQLPVIVLTGPRAGGKTTFAEVIAEIFPELSSDWSGEATNFTPFFTKKLLIIEENYINKKSQYQQLKGVTGNSYLTVNEKFVPQYKVRNNIKIIMTTNEARPLFLVAGETPNDANNNNFFIYKVPQVKEINPRVKEQILERLGHYIQTELRERYEKWNESNARYSIPCPITPLAKDLYASSLTGIEADAELIAEAVVCGIRDDDWKDGYTTIGGNEYIMKTEFNRICKRLGVRSAKSNNEYFKKLQDTGVVAYQETRTKHGRGGYKVLVTRDAYK